LSSSRFCNAWLIGLNPKPKNPEGHIWSQTIKS
jgi:hypothetical protein